MRRFPHRRGRRAAAGGPRAFTRWQWCAWRVAARATAVAAVAVLTRAAEVTCTTAPAVGRALAVTRWRAFGACERALVAPVLLSCVGPALVTFLARLHQPRFEFGLDDALEHAEVGACQRRGLEGAQQRRAVAAGFQFGRAVLRALRHAGFTRLARRACRLRRAIVHAGRRGVGAGRAIGARRTVGTVRARGARWAISARRLRSLRWSVGAGWAVCARRAVRPVRPIGPRRAWRPWRGGGAIVEHCSGALEAAVDIRH